VDLTETRKTNIYNNILKDKHIKATTKSGIVSSKSAHRKLIPASLAYSSSPSLQGSLSRQGFLSASAEIGIVDAVVPNIDGPH
jgi:hypothetical protein